MRQIHSYRELMSGIEAPVQLENGTFKVPINFDNGATTPPFKCVNEAILKAIEMYGPIHRGGQKAYYSTANFERIKLKILQFLGLQSQDGYCVIYVKNTTEGINLLAHQLCSMERNVKVLGTRMEHHANDLPWRRYAEMDYVETDEVGKLKIEEFEEKLKIAKGAIQYVTVTAASNVTGYINPIHDIARIAHKYGAKIIVDAAQLVAHQAIQMKGNHKEEAIDFLVFSAHKMYAPFGMGVVIARKELLQKSTPHLLGGGSVVAVLDQDVYFKDSPYKEEPGTPNYLGVVALGAAVEQLSKIGMQEVIRHEQVLKDYMLKAFTQMSHIKLYGDAKEKERLGAIVWNMEGAAHEQVTDYLESKAGIAVRNGCFCAQPYVKRLLHITDEEHYQSLAEQLIRQPGMVRVSFGIYNTLREVDECLECIEYMKNKKLY